MTDKNKSLQSGAGFLKVLIITAIVISIAWIVGKGVLTLISSVKQM